MDPEDLDACIVWWQNILNVLHWTIENRIVAASRMTSKINLMEFRPTRARMHAVILIREDVLQKYDVFEVQKLIVHELSHLIYDPIAEEHFNQQKYSDDHSRDDEYLYRFNQALEKAVEHTARMLCKAMPMQTKW